MNRTPLQTAFASLRGLRGRCPFLAPLLCSLLVSAPLFAEDVPAEKPAGDASAALPGNLVHYDLKGKRFSLADYVKVEGEFAPIPAKQGPMILVFGAHWCKPCKEVMAKLHDLEGDLALKGVTRVYVHVDDVDRGNGKNNKEIKTLAKEMAEAESFAGVTVLLGGDLEELNTWMDQPEGNVLPGVVFINADGTLFARGAERFDETLAAFLQASPPKAAP